MQIQSTKCLFIKVPCLVLWIVSASSLSQRERDMSRSVQQQTGSLILIFCLCRRCRASREKISINSTNAPLSLDFAKQCSESFETTLFAILCQHQSLVVISLVKPSWKCGIGLNAITLFSAYCSYLAHFSLSTHLSLFIAYFSFLLLIFCFFISPFLFYSLSAHFSLSPHSLSLLIFCLYSYVCAAHSSFHLFHHREAKKKDKFQEQS